PVTHLLNAFEDESDFVVYVDDGDAHWSARCARQADRVLLVGVGTGVVAPPPPQVEDAATHHLLLLQPDEAREASGTAAWLSAHAVVSHHHVRLGVPNDMQRVARLLTGYGIGVAFSGAAARGAAHVGVLFAFEELGLPIDIVAGNSSGASIAASVAQGASAAVTLQRYRYCLDAIGPRWTNLGPPFVSLMSGRGTASALREVFGDARMEDQFIPVIMSATDLARGQRVAIDRGPLWLGLRASASLPAYWPPVCQDGQVLVDGGVMANLPVEALEPSCASGLMIASDLDISGSETFRAFQGVEEYGHTLSGWRVAFSPKGRYPRLNEVITHAMCLSSYAHRELIIALSARPNVIFVRPRVEVSGFFGLSSNEASALVKVARADALEQVTPAWNLHRERLGKPARPVEPVAEPTATSPFMPNTKRRRWVRAALVLLVLLAAFVVWANVRAAQLQAMLRPIPASTLPVPFPLSESERAELEPGQDPDVVAHERGVARGRHVMRARLGCVDCHGEDLSGGPVMDVPLIGRAFAPNITRGGVTRAYSSEDWERIVRHGVRPNGLAALMPVMESAMISDQEVADVIVYARSLPAREVVQPESGVGVLGAVLFALDVMRFSADEVSHSAARLVRPPSLADPIAYGEHLAHTCRPCHGSDLGGGPIPGGDPSWPVAANLTSHAEGLAAWTQDDFVRLLKEGKRPDGSAVNPIMPWRISRHMQDAELHALFLYLRSVPPVAGPL
ncbi:MAG: patatin-like phospholipase family protein, partial [Myxococcales bacterium]|nr:patatin-like phospholipase family protein [Myxococcales bacterium]